MISIDCIQKDKLLIIGIRIAVVRLS